MLASEVCRFDGDVILQEVYDVLGLIYEGYEVGELRLSSCINNLVQLRSHVLADAAKDNVLAWNPIGALDQVKKIYLLWRRLMTVAPLQYSELYKQVLLARQAILMFLLDQIILKKQELPVEILKSSHVIDGYCVLGAALWDCILRAHFQPSEVNVVVRQKSRDLLQLVFNDSQDNSLESIDVEWIQLEAAPSSFRTLSAHDRLQHLILALKMFALQSVNDLSIVAKTHQQAVPGLQFGILLYLPFDFLLYERLPTYSSDFHEKKLLIVPPFSIMCTKPNPTVSSQWLRLYMPLKNILFFAPTMAAQLIPSEPIIELLMNGNVCIAGAIELAASFSLLDLEQVGHGLFYESIAANNLAKTSKLKNLAIGAAMAMLGHFGAQKILDPPSNSITSEPITVEVQTPAPSVGDNKNLHTSRLNAIHQQHKEALKTLPKELQAISFIESSGGHNLKHRMINHGMHKGTRAIGSLGLMPILISEIVKKNPQLKNDYGHLLKYHPRHDFEQIEHVVMSDPKMYYRIAQAHWNKLHRVFKGDVVRMAHAWHHGIHGTFNKTDEDILQSEYVQKFLHHYKRLNPQRPFVNVEGPSNLAPQENNQKLNVLSKSIEILPDSVDVVGHQYQFDLDPLTLENHPEAEKIAQRINEYIRAHHIYHFKAVGKYLRHSFIVGNPEDNSSDLWLLKVDIKEAPKHLIYSKASYAAREYAFYLCAKELGLQQYIPETYLGLWSFRNEKGLLEQQPAVAIKVLPFNTRTLRDAFSVSASAVKSSLIYWFHTGILYKLAALLYILGNFDAHDQNCMISRDRFYLIDHGLSFVESYDDFNTELGEVIHLPAFMDYMTKGHQADQIPLVQAEQTLKDLKFWLLTVPLHTCRGILESLGLQAAFVPCYERWKELVALSQKYRVDEAIIKAWMAAYQGYWVDSTEGGEDAS